MSDHADSLHDVFREFGAITVRRMFGGHRMYRDGLLFAPVADDTVYLEADGQSAGEFETRGLPRFEYRKRGKAVSPSYYAAPEAIVDDAEAAGDRHFKGPNQCGAAVAGVHSRGEVNGCGRVALRKDLTPTSARQPPIPTPGRLC